LIVDTDKLVSDDAYREDMRHRFLTDHFFAARMLGFEDFTERAHGPAVRLYGPKNPMLPMRAQRRKRRLIHLDPRHTFKTSLKRVDRVQWIAAFSQDVTILNQSATQPLALAVSQKTANVFWRQKGRPATIVQLMFPEAVTDAKPGFAAPDFGWDTPNRRMDGAGDLDHTLAFTSPQSTQSGWHPFILDNDDVEDTKNSGIRADPEVRQGVIDTVEQNENLLRDGGYLYIGGTRYHPLDYYGKCLQQAQMNPDAWDVLVRCSVRRLDGQRILPGQFPAEDEVELLLGEFANLSYTELRDKYYQNYESFMCQQQNDPMGGSLPKFDERMYDSCLIQPDRVPLEHLGSTYLCFRPQYGGKKDMMRYTEGVAVRITGERIYVLDCWQGTYTPSGLAAHIVSQQKRYGAKGVMIFQTPGSEHIGAHVRNEAARRNVSLRVQWETFVDDDHVRVAKMEALEPLLKVGRVSFSTAMTKGAECRSQFVNFGMTLENGIIECIAKLADLVPVSQLRASMQEEELEYQRRRREDAQMNHYLSVQGVPVMDELARQKAEAHLAAMSKVSHRGLPRLPGGLDG